MRKLNYSKMPVLTLGALAERVTSTAELHKIGDPIVSAKLQELKTVCETYQMGLNKRNYSDLTKKIKEKDKERDKLIRGMRKFAVSQVEAPLKEISEAAKRARRIFSSYLNKVEEAPFGEESGKIDVFLNIFGNKENADIIELLNLRCWIEALRNLQNEFAELQSERVDSKTELQNIKSASSLRKELVTALLEFFDYVRASIMINNNRELKSLLGLIEVIKQETALSLSKQRRKVRHNEEETVKAENIS